MNFLTLSELSTAYSVISSFLLLALRALCVTVRAGLPLLWGRFPSGEEGTAAHPLGDGRRLLFGSGPRSRARALGPAPRGWLEPVTLYRAACCEGRAG